MRCASYVRRLVYMVAGAVAIACSSQAAEKNDAQHSALQAGVDSAANRLLTALRTGRSGPCGQGRRRRRQGIALARRRRRARRPTAAAPLSIHTMPLTHPRVIHRCGPGCA